MKVTNCSVFELRDPAAELGSEGDVPLSTARSLPCEPSGDDLVGDAPRRRAIRLTFCARQLRVSELVSSTQLPKSVADTYDPERIDSDIYRLIGS